jgi:dTDP-4-dehydrorhamnose 3,5-epimerase
MRFTPAGLDGAYLVEPERHADDRGHFARTFCAREFAERGLTPAIAQSSISYNHARGTLRGMHYQLPPAAEAKLVRCTHGAVYDVLVDLRPDSPTYLRHVAVELTADEGAALYVPELVAHGFQTLEPGTEVAYQISEFHSPEHARGFRHDDPLFSIEWPLPVSAISERDLSWPDYEPTTAGRLASYQA